MIVGAKVINLDRRSDRFEKFKDQYDRSNLKDMKLERFSAIDGTNIINDINNKNLQHDPIFKALKCLNRNIPKGELGCLLSHYFILREISNDQSMTLNDMVLIFEDDAFFSGMFDKDKSFFNEISEFIKNEQVDFLYVSGRFKSNFVPQNMSFFEQCGNHLFKRLSGDGHDWDRCTPGYICSKNGAIQMCLRILKQFSQTKTWMAIDTIYAITSQNVKSYDFFPHIYYAKPDYQTDVQGKNLKNVIHTSDLIFS